MQWFKVFLMYADWTMAHQDQIFGLLIQETVADFETNHMKWFWVN